MMAVHSKSVLVVCGLRAQTLVAVSDTCMYTAGAVYRLVRNGMHSPRIASSSLPSSSYCVSSEPPSPPPPPEGEEEEEGLFKADAVNEEEEEEEEDLWIINFLWSCL